MKQTFRITISNEDGDSNHWKLLIDPNDSLSIEDEMMHLASDLTYFIKEEGDADVAINQTEGREVETGLEAGREKQGKKE